MNRQSSFAVLSLAAILVTALGGAFAPPPPAAQGQPALPDPAAPESLPRPDPAGPTALTWSIETIDQAKAFRSMEDRHLALDAAGRPHIAYGDNNLFYAWHDGTMWHYETVHVSNDVGEHAALRLDAQDRPHIGYYDRFYGDLRYAWRAGPQDWRLEVVDEAVGSC